MLSSLVHLPYQKISIHAMYYKSVGLYRRITGTKSANNINIIYKLCKSKNYFYDCYHSISRRKAYSKWNKWSMKKDKKRKRLKRKTEKVGDSSNKDGAGARKSSINNSVLRKFRKYYRKIPEVSFLINLTAAPVNILQRF